MVTSTRQSMNRRTRHRRLTNEHILPGHRLSIASVRYVRFTSSPAGRFAHIVLKNSDFRFDHNSEDRWQPRWKIPWGFGGRAAFAACDPPIWLAVATTGLDPAMGAKTRFSRSLNFRVFQHYPQRPVVRRRLGKRLPCSPYCQLTSQLLGKEFTVASSASLLLPAARFGPALGGTERGAWTALDSELAHEHTLGRGFKG